MRHGVYVSFLAGVMASLYMLITPVLAAEDQPKKFAPLYQADDPYEQVLAAENYRKELMAEELPEESWYEVYYKEAYGLYKKALITDPNFTYGYLSYGYFLLVAADTFPKQKPSYYLEAEGLIPQLYLNEQDKQAFIMQLAALRKDHLAAREALEKYKTLGGKTDSRFYAWAAYILSMEGKEQQGQAAKYYRKAQQLDTDRASVVWVKEYASRNGVPKIHPPLMIPGPGRKGIHPKATRMCLRMGNFTDSTGIAGKFTQILPRMLELALFKGGRFRLLSASAFDKSLSSGQIISDALIEIDFISAIPARSQLLLSVKAVEPSTGYILFADTLSITYQKVPEALEEREVGKLGDLIERRLGKGEGHVIQISGRYLLIDLGSNHGMQVGLKAYVLGRGEQIVKEPKTGKELGKDLYLAEIILERVEDKFSAARLLNQGRIEVRVGDIVRIK